MILEPETTLFIGMFSGMAVGYALGFFMARFIYRAHDWGVGGVRIVRHENGSNFTVK